MDEYVRRKDLLSRIKPPCDDDYRSAVLMGDVREIIREFVMSTPAAADVVEVPQEYACYTDFDDENYLLHLTFPISEKQFKAIGAGSDLWETLRGESNG